MQKQFDKNLVALLSLIKEDTAANCHFKLLLAVSGGVDSICMADLMYKSKLPNISFSIAHCNFHLRGDDSDADALFVKEWAEQRSIPIFTIDFDTKTYARTHSISIEMAARELRYDWFQDLLLKHGFDALLVAHNANDNAETLVLNLVRGTGLKGICGIQKLSYRNFSAEGKEYRLPILRPLLQFTRKQIEGYAFSNRIAWREDVTNHDSSYKRNYIRNEVLPVLEKLNPSLIQTLNREMDYFSQLGTWKQSVYDELQAYNFNSLVIGQILDLMESDRTQSGKVFTSKTHVLVTTTDSYIVKPISEISDVLDSTSLKVTSQAEKADKKNYIEVSVSEENKVAQYDFNGRKISAEYIELQEDGFSLEELKQKNVTYIDISNYIEVFLKSKEVVCFAEASDNEDVMSEKFIIRGWREGDWMRPMGMKGRKKKVSDIFTNLKLNLFQKKECLVLADSKQSSHVLSILGIRVDETVKICPSTHKILKLTIE